MKIKAGLFTLIILGLLSFLYSCSKDKGAKLSPVITTLQVSNISANTASCGGDISIDGVESIMSRGVCWGLNQFPTISDHKTNDGAGTGSFTSTLYGLIIGSTYFVRAYATNPSGTVYGNQLSFQTISTVPVIITNDVTAIGVREATCGGNIVSDGGSVILSSGLCWSTNQNPTIVDSKTINGLVFDYFNSMFTGLTPETTYYIRAYASNSLGIGYGQQITFKTLRSALSDMKFVTIQGGTYNNGLAQITLSDFRLAETEMTQAVWLEIMGSNPGYHNGNLQYPIENVSWDNAQIFISKLKEITGKNYRLPTEAEWEYAAGGGATNRNVWAGTDNSSNLGNYAWYDVNSQNMTHIVGTKLPNVLGLYDMCGNVWEWCYDWYAPYTAGSKTNPTGPLSGNYKVQRGGSWLHPDTICTVANRIYVAAPTTAKNYIGFRLVFVP